MKKLVLLFVLAIFLYGCGSPHRCPTYADSGAKWHKKQKSGGHPYGKH